MKPLFVIFFFCTKCFYLLEGYIVNAPGYILDAPSCISNVLGYIRCNVPQGGAGIPSLS